VRPAGGVASIGGRRRLLGVHAGLIGLVSSASVLVGSWLPMHRGSRGVEGSLEKKPPPAPKNLRRDCGAMLIGLALNYARLDAIKMLFWSAW